MVKFDRWPRWGTWLRQLTPGLSSLGRKRQSLGQRGEALAARYLRREQKYRIIARGERNAGGEIDLIALDGDTIVFTEVKTRSSDQRGDPAEAVNWEKRRRLTLAALAYLKQHDLLDQPARFDVVSITWPADGRSPQLQHFRDAFPAEGDTGLY